MNPIVAGCSETLLWPEYIIARYNYPDDKSSLPGLRARYPNFFSRKVISKVASGCPIQKDVQVNQKKKRPYPCVRYKCLGNDSWNPHRPESPGAPGADLTLKWTVRQGDEEPIPIFCNRGNSQWEYVGHYRLLARNDYFTTAERYHPSIAQLLKNWITAFNEKLHESGETWAKAIFRDSVTSLHEIDIGDVTENTLAELFRKRVLRAYWIYLNFDHYDENLYELLDREQKVHHGTSECRQPTNGKQSNNRDKEIQRVRKEELREPNKAKKQRLRRRQNATKTKTFKEDDNE